MAEPLPARGRITPAALSWPNTALLRVGDRVFNPCLIEAADFHDDGEVTLYFAGDQQLFRGEQAAFVRWFLTQHSSTGEVHVEAAAPAPAKADVWLPEPGWHGGYKYTDNSWITPSSDHPGSFYLDLHASRVTTGGELNGGYLRYFPTALAAAEALAAAGLGPAASPRPETAKAREVVTKTISAEQADRIASWGEFPNNGAPDAASPNPMAADPYARAWQPPAERVVAEAVTDGFEEFEQERKHVGPVS